MLHNNSHFRIRFRNNGKCSRRNWGFAGDISTDGGFNSTMYKNEHGIRPKS
jgi:hypothetical protein